MNVATEIVHALQSIASAVQGQTTAAWVPWTPVWSSTGTQPAIGNGTLTGAYTIIGKTVHFRLKLIGGSTTTWGTGTYLITLPAIPHVGIAANDSIALSGYAEDVGVTPCRIEAGRMFNTTQTYIIMSAAGGASQWAQGWPFTWGTSDYWSAVGTYEMG